MKNDSVKSLVLSNVFNMKLVTSGGIIGEIFSKVWPLLQSLVGKIYQKMSKRSKILVRHVVCPLDTLSKIDQNWFDFLFYEICYIKTPLGGVKSYQKIIFGGEPNIFKYLVKLKVV